MVTGRCERTGGGLSVHEASASAATTAEAGGELAAQRRIWIRAPRVLGRRVRLRCRPARREYTRPALSPEIIPTGCRRTLLFGFMKLGGASVSENPFYQALTRSYMKTK